MLIVTGIKLLPIRRLFINLLAINIYLLKINCFETYFELQKKKTFNVVISKHIVKYLY